MVLFTTLRIAYFVVKWVVIIVLGVAVPPFGAILAAMFWLLTSAFEVDLQTD